VPGAVGKVQDSEIPDSLATDLFSEVAANVEGVTDPQEGVDFAGNARPGETLIPGTVFRNVVLSSSQAS